VNALASEPELLVVRHAGVLWEPPHWEFRRTTGEPVAALTRRSAGGVFGGSAKWLVADEAGPVWWLEQRSSMFSSTFEVAGAGGEPLGSLVQENAVLAPQFRLTAADGMVARLDGGRMGSWDWSLEDLDGTQLGQVSREMTGVLDMVAKERTYVVRRGAQLPRGLWPLAALSCVCWDIVHERKRRSDGGSVSAG
jgi:hypothetical protein